MHQSQDPSAVFPLAERMSDMVVLSNPCSSIRGAAGVDSWRLNVREDAAGGAMRTWRRTVPLITLPFAKIARIPPCIVAASERTYG